MLVIKAFSPPPLISFFHPPVHKHLQHVYKGQRLNRSHILQLLLYYETEEFSYILDYAKKSPGNDSESTPSTRMHIYPLI